MDNKILVIGATGNVGSHLVKLLSDKGESVKAATRNPEKYPSMPNVEAVEFDYERPDTFGPALADVNRLFVIARNADPVADEVINPFLDQAKQAGVQYIVLMTAMGVDQAPDELAYRQVELYLMSLGVDYTILRPNWFMQNFNPGFILPMVKQGTIYLPAGEGKTSFIDTRDIAAVAATVLTEDWHVDAEYTLTGSEALTYAEAAEILSKATGRNITYVPVSDDDIRQALANDGWQPGQIEMMVGLFNGVRQGWSAPVTPTVSVILGRDPISLEQFAQENAEAWK